ncbi:MAG: hypothetical protein ACI81R_002269 [Bradymonadia bacterium]|jgi:hypothetical protein
MTSSRVLRVAALSAVAAFAACDEAAAPNTSPDDTVSSEARDQTLVIERPFVARFDPTSQELTFEYEPARQLVDSPSGLRVVWQADFCPIRVSASVENSLVLTTDPATIGSDLASCGFSGHPYTTLGVFCAEVTATSRFVTPLTTVYARLNEITPSVGYNGYQSPYGNGVDPATIPALINAPNTSLGLWSYGDLLTDEPASTQWVLENFGGAFTFRGSMIGQVGEMPNGFDDDCDGLIDEGIGVYDLGDDCADDSDCLSDYCTGGICSANACLPGFEPDGLGGCQDIDECALDNGGCGASAAVSCVDQTNLAPVCVCDADPLRSQILAGVPSVDFGGSLPSQMLLDSRESFAIIADTQGRIMVAGGHFGDGRFATWGHEGAMNTDFADPTNRGVLARNIVDWLAGAPGATVGVSGGFTNLRNNLTAAGYIVVSTTPSSLAGVDVFIGELWNSYSASDNVALQDFVAAGGGMMLGGHAWYWNYSNDDPLTNYPGNQTLAGMGVVVSTETTSNGDIADLSNATNLANAMCALDVLLDEVTTGAPSNADVTDAARAAGYASSFFPWGHGFITAATAVADTYGDVVPTSANRVLDTETLERFILRTQIARALRAPWVDVVPHDAGSDFPGPVAASAPRVTQTLTIDADYQGYGAGFSYSNSGADVWRSTGLYAAPGEPITVTLDAGGAGQGLGVRVGSHQDNLYNKDEWLRVPEITRWEPLTAATTTLANGFGGLVYITVPGGTTLGTISVTIGGAVEAPSFQLGVDDDATWVASLRDRGAPYGELVSESMITTFDADTLKVLADAGDVTQFWEDMMDASSDFAGLPQSRPRPERIVYDRQISAGLMHSGYPVMGHDYQQLEMIDYASLAADGSWGPFHEIGHNHQWNDWLLDGTTETTCNLWAVYVMEHVVGLPSHNTHPAITAASRTSRKANYLASPDYSTWSVWLALDTYLQLQEEFGWAFFTNLFVEYRALTDAESPSGNDERIQQWIVRSSIEAGMDLTAFYAAWDFPIDAATYTAVSALPAWTTHPMQ